jgi:hypothetical protein
MADKDAAKAAAAGASFRADGSSRKVNIVDSLDGAITLQKKFPKGAVVPVYYNPKDPEQHALINDSTNAGGKVLWMVSGFLLVLGAVVYYFFRD